MDEILKLEYIPVEMKEWELNFTVVRTPDGIFFPLRPICKRLGLDLNTQYGKIREDSDLEPHLQEWPIPTARGPRKAECLRRKAVGLWLLNIQPNRVNEQFRDRLSQFRLDLMLIADRFMFGNKPELLEEAEVTTQKPIRGELHFGCPHCGASLCLVIDGQGSHILVGEAESSLQSGND